MGGDAVSVLDKGWLYHPDYPDDWERRPLYSMAQWVNGLAFRDIQFSASGMPVIKIAEIKDGISGQTKFTEQAFDDSVRVKPGDLLFSWSGQPETSIDAFWWRGPEGWLNQHVFRVTPADGIDPTFFYYLLRYLKPNFIGIARNKQTTGLGHVTRRDLENIEGGYPPLPEQRAIAHILGTLDDKIELNRRMSETLEALARALFKSWFVDFDPVHAKRRGTACRAPTCRALTAGRAHTADVAPTDGWQWPQHILDLFPDRLVDSELGEIPEGWEVGNLTCFANLNPESWSEEDYPASISYVDLSNTKWGRIETVTRYSRAEAPSRAQRVLRPGDTIVGTVRPGNGSYTLILEDGLTGSTGFAVLRPLAPENREFVYLAATRPENIEALSHLADGGAYPAVRPEVVASTLVVKPPTALLQFFSVATRGLLDRIGMNEHESRTLASLRDALLPKLISGKMRIKDAERFLKERGQ